MRLGRHANLPNMSFISRLPAVFEGASVPSHAIAVQALFKMSHRKHANFFTLVPIPDLYLSGCRTGYKHHQVIGTGSARRLPGKKSDNTPLFLESAARSQCVVCRVSLSSQFFSFLASPVRSLKVYFYRECLVFCLLASRALVLL